MRLKTILVLGAFLIAAFLVPGPKKVPKMTPQLRMLIALYRSSGTIRSDSSSWTLKGDQVLNAIENLAEKRTRRTERAEKKGKKEFKINWGILEKKLKKNFGKDFKLTGDNLLKEFGKRSYLIGNSDVYAALITTNSDPSFLNSYSVKIHGKYKTDKGYAVTCDIPISRAKEIAEDKNVKRVYVGMKAKPTLNRSVPASGAEKIRLRQYSDFPKGYTGKGVVIGDVDTGIDWSHEDFIDPTTGKTRIKYIWDQTVDTPGQTPADSDTELSGFNYGTEWTADDIDSGLVTEADTEGHGTHVTGIAAGNGYATGEGYSKFRYVGMAPKADIIMVKTDFYTSSIDDGIKYIFQKAKEMGKPAVVNLSLGFGFYLMPYGGFGLCHTSNPNSYYYNYPTYMYAYGSYFPADGTDDWDSGPMDAIVDEYGDGYVVAKAAGNDGSWNTYTDLSGGSYPYQKGAEHAKGDLASGAQTHKFTVYDKYVDFWLNNWGYGPYSMDFPVVNFAFWYTGGTAIKVDFIGPNGTTLSGQTGDWNWVWDPHTSPPFDGDAWFSMSPWPSPYNGDMFGFGEITYSYNAYYYGYTDYQYYVPAPGEWTLKVEPVSGLAKYDVWTYDYDVWLQGLIFLMGYHTYSPFTTNYDYGKYIIDSSVSDKVVTVGSWTTKTNWLSHDGSTYTYVMQPWMGTISDFSSPGPTRDGRVKPEIAAPGEIVISSAPPMGTASEFPTESDYAEDGVHGQMSGTSMATPHVTGAIALILQKYAVNKGQSVSLARVKKTLESWARVDLHVSGFGGPPNNGFGYGKLDVVYLKDAPVAIAGGVTTLGKVKGNKIYVGQEITLDGSSSYDPDDFPITYKWSMDSKPSGSSATIKDADKEQAKFTPDKPGSYVIKLIVNNGVWDSKPSTLNLNAVVPVSPPANLNLQRVENTNGFQVEYVNKLTWEDNPQNANVKVVKYRIYRRTKGSTASMTIVGEVNASTHQWLDRKLGANDYYEYGVTAVDNKGNESLPAYASN